MWNYPPYPYLEMVCTHCPKASRTYLDIWNQKDSLNRLLVNKKEIKTRFLQKTTSFLDNLLLIVREGLISIEETKSQIIIEIVDWNEDFE